jgi:hypothetical protein
MAVNIARKKVGKRGPKRLGINYRIVVTIDKETNDKLELERDLSKMRITEIGRRAIVDYLAAREKERATTTT